MGATPVLFDGNPGYPNLNVLWRLAAETGVKVFGTSAPFLMACRKAGLQPGRDSGTELSPRHLPDDIFAVSDIPCTLTGKKLEVPVKKILMGMPVEKAVNFGSMGNPESMGHFIEMVARLNS